jgi:hypothetical protein
MADELGFDPRKVADAIYDAPTPLANLVKAVADALRSFGLEPNNVMIAAVLAILAADAATAKGGYNGWMQ